MPKHAKHARLLQASSGKVGPREQLLPAVNNHTGASESISSSLWTHSNGLSTSRIPVYALAG